MSSRLELGHDELLQRLRDFDRAIRIEFPGREFTLVLVGGGAMVLLGVLSRPTADLDVLNIPGDIVTLMEQYDISCSANSYIHNFAYNYEDRLVPLELGTTSITCYSVSLEDIVASKLHSFRTPDEQDVRRPEVLAAIDWNVLDQIAADMIDSRLNERQHSEFVASYNRFREEYGPCDD